MGKKKGMAVPLLYLIGMAVAAVGCFLPLYYVKLIGKHDGVSIWGMFINNCKSSNPKVFTIICAFVIMSAVIAGIVFCFIKIGKITGLLRLICAIAAAGTFTILFFTNIPGSDAGRKLAKGLAKGIHLTPHVGFYLFLAGVIVAIIGWVMSKKD